MPVAKKVATATCHHPPKKCRLPKKWRPGRAIALARDAGRQKNGDRDVAALPKRQGDCLGRVLGHLGCLLKPLGCLLGRLGRHLGASWGHLGTSWGGLGASWERLGGLLGAPLEKYRKKPMFWTPLGSQIGSQNPRKSTSKKECYTIITICRFFRFLQNFHRSWLPKTNQI